VNSLETYNIDYSIAKSVDIVKLVDYEIFPIFEDDIFIIVASSNIEQETKEIMKLFNKPVKFIHCDTTYIKLELNYLQLKYELYTLAKNSLLSVGNNLENSYILQFIDFLIKQSVDLNSSDIHIESFEDSLIIRLRIDGILNQFFRFDIQLFSQISSILKFLSSLDISQKRLPLNGRFTREIGDTKYEFRLSTLPNIYGESIVLRILDNKNIQKDIDSIGFDQKSLYSFKKNISSTQGLILVTGPTGSGKTTTLYSALNFLNNNSKKIITIEDPVEYKLDGVVQVNINNDIDLDYHTVLKNVLRQDPDILMIGEIRDTLSLHIAIRAALTGHLVIATLHTNNCVETISRLFDLKAEPYLVATTLKMVISQRLVRILCEDCKVYDENLQSYKAIGCHKCNLTGYKSRQVVEEVLNIDEPLSKMVGENYSTLDILEKAKQRGFKTLSQKAQELIKDGLTSLEEYYNKISYEI